MIKPSLTLHQNVLQPTSGPLLVKELTNIPSVQKSWQRSIRRDGGYWIGRFRVEGLPREQLRQIYGTWLGKHLVEKTSGITWEGMVYEITLHDGISRRMSLEDMANKVTPIYQELLSNPGFEKSEGIYAFTNWLFNIAGSDTITAETVNVATGNRSAKLTRVNNGSTYIYQTVNVLEKTTYRVSFYTRGDGTVGGRYRVYDVSNAADIIPITNTSSNSRYTRITQEIVTPPGCTSLRLYLYVPSGVGTAYYDNASIERLIGGFSAYQPGVTNSDSGSQSIYGTKEALVEANNEQMAEHAAEEYLAHYAYPKTSRGTASGDEVALDVVVVGYIFTTKWIYSTFTDWGTEYNTAVLIQELLDECPYINQTVLRSPDGNAALQPKAKPRTIRDSLNDALKTGNADTPQTWRLYMTANRTAVFETIPADPLYAISNGQFVHSRANRTPITNPYIVTPGVVRDLDNPERIGKSGAFFVDPRDFLLDEITVGPNGLRWSEGVI